ncbi:MAG: prolyl oligopeptidase family serine peptidase [Phycisphaerae bacterium]|nr:prolyl oligopeptidase family serine peptidase [Phycisphaerae bacterium]
MKKINLKTLFVLLCLICGIAKSETGANMNDKNFSIDANDYQSVISYMVSQYVKEQPDVNVSNEKLIQRYKILRYLTQLNLFADKIEKNADPNYSGVKPDEIRKFISDTLKQTNLEQMYKGRTLRFTADSKDAAIAWEKNTRQKLFELLGISDLVKRQSLPLNEKELSTEDRGDFIIRQMEIDATPTRRMIVLVGIPKKACKSYPAVVCLAGHGSKRDGPYDLSPQSVQRGFGSVLTSGGVITTAHGISHSVYEQGRSLAGERVWDAMRCIDYLYSLPQVDKTKIGCAGLSIGGEMTMWLAAMDERCKVAVSCGFLTFMDQMEHHHCQCWQHPGMRDLVDWPDLYCLIAPRYLQCQNGLAEPLTQFHVPVARAAMEEIKPIYDVFDCPQNVELFVHDEGHVINLPALVRFFENAFGQKIADNL